MLAFRIRSKSEQATEVFSQESGAQVVSTTNQMSHLYRHRRSYRLLFLTVLTLIGLYLLAGSGIGTAGMPMHRAAPHTAINASSLLRTV